MALVGWGVPGGGAPGRVEGAHAAVLLGLLAAEGQKPWERNVATCASEAWAFAHGAAFGLEKAGRSGRGRLRRRDRGVGATGLPAAGSLPALPAALTGV